MALRGQKSKEMNKEVEQGKADIRIILGWRR